MMQMLALLAAVPLTCGTTFLLWDLHRHGERHRRLQIAVGVLTLLAMLALPFAAWIVIVVLTTAISYPQ